MENLIKGYPPIPQSVTNVNVIASNALDRNQSFSFIEFIKVVNVTYEPETLQLYYTTYLKDWNKQNTGKDISNTDLIINSYRDFLKDITLNFSNQTEKKFLLHIDFNDNNDLSIAMSFFSKKLREIIAYYKEERVTLPEANTIAKTKSSNFNIIKSAYTAVINFLDSREDKAIDYDIDTIKRDINISLTEYFDTYTSYFNQEPDESEYGKHFLSYSLDDLPSDNIFLVNNRDLVAEVFSSYNEELKLALEVDSIFDNKRGLTEKYIGTDFYYISSNASGEFVYDILVKADKPYSDFLNQKAPSTASVFANNISTAREVGYFKPSNTGINVIEAPAIDFELNTVYEPDSLFIFPDPKLFTNNQNILVFNIEVGEFFKNLTSGSARLLPSTSKENTSFLGYSSQTSSRTQESDLAFVFDSGYVDDSKKDLFGNIFGLVKDNNYFRQNLVLEEGRVVKNLILNGYQFYDSLYDEGYSFNYNTVDSSTFKETIRSGLTSFTNGLTATEVAPYFPSSAYNIFFRYFAPYQELIEASNFNEVDFVTPIIETADVFDGAFFMKTDTELLPDPISSDLSAFSNTAQQFYFTNLLDGGIAKLSSANTPELDNKIQRALLDDTNSFTESLTGSFSNTLRLTSINDSYFNYEGGRFTDPLNFEYSPAAVEYDYNDTVYKPTAVITNTTKDFNKATASSLQGKIYVKNASTNKSGELFDILPYLSSKFNSSIVSDLSSNVINFDLLYDTLFIQTSSYFIIESLSFEDNKFIDALADGISLDINTNNYDDISNRVKIGSNVYYYKLVVEQDSTTTTTLSVYPEIYKYSYADKKNRLIFPGNSTELAANINIFSLSCYDILYSQANSLNINYRSDMDMFNINYILKDQNLSPLFVNHVFNLDNNEKVNFMRDDYVRAVFDNRTYTFEQLNVLSAFNFNLSALPLRVSNDALIL